MNFNLSSICEMLGDRIEEYHTTSKKRKMARDSFAPKSKMAKLTKEQNGLTMFASTPLEASKIETKQFSAMFSSVTKLPTPITVKRNTEHPIIKARKLSFDDGEDSNVDEIPELEKSPTNLSSVTRLTTLETIKRRGLQRTNLVAKRLFVNEEDQNDIECLSKGYASKALTPLYTPKRNCISKRRMNARKLSFSDEENEDTVELSSSLSSSLSEDKLISMESMEWSNSKTMMLSVGIFIRPIRDNSK